MEDYAVVQAHAVLLLLLAFLLTAFCSYVWTSWRIRVQRIRAERPRSKFPAFTRCRELGMSAKLISSLASEWLAPLIAWLVVILAILAIVGLMFAEE